MSPRLWCFLLFAIVLLAPAVFADPVIVNYDFGAVQIACSNGYAYQGPMLSCPYTGPTQNFNDSPGFGWTLGSIGSGLTGPNTVFFPPPFTGLPFTQAVFLQGGHNPSVSQAVGGFTAGSYILSFYLGSRYRNGCCDGNQTVMALIDGNVIGTWVLASYTPFTLVTAPFSVTSGGSHTLKFVGMHQGDHTAFLSYVVITPNPAPER